MQSCSTAQCAEQVPEKVESQSAAKEDVGSSLLPATVTATTVKARRFADPQRELTQGIRYSAAIFRLKDDLRI